MAGEWIKMRADLLDDPTVFRMADLLAVDELTVVGALFCFWAWVDKHSVDGRVDGATSRLIDRVTHKPGFTEALVAVGWLVLNETGATIPHFERHNGESAKERSLKNQRQARWREKKAAERVDVPVDATPSTRPSTREEKRREEPKSKEESKAGRGSRLPTDWQPDADLSAWARAERPALNLHAEIENFRDYWHAKSGKDATKLDWPATFRVWIRKSHQGKPHEQSRHGASRRLSVVDRIQANVDAIERRDQREPIAGTAVHVRTG